MRFRTVSMSLGNRCGEEKRFIRPRTDYLLFLLLFSALRSIQNLYLIIYCKHEIHSILSGNQYKITLRLLRGVTFNDAEHVCVTCCNGYKSNHFYCHITTAHVPW